MNRGYPIFIISHDSLMIVFPIFYAEVKGWINYIKGFIIYQYFKRLGKAFYS